ASKPAYHYNPLFIYGGSGLGKTHLLHAICNELLKKDLNANIVYVTGETFTNEMIESLRSSAMPSFRMKYRDADVLLIDDIQFIAHKEGIQEEFFHTFDFLYQAHRQIVLTSDRLPKEIATLEDRLRSRFESGLLADIQPPDLETRMAIITRKAEQMDMYISPEVCEYIASQLKSNIRQLEGVVKKMRAAYLLTGENPSLSSAQSAIRVVRSDMQPTPITIEKIIEEVARTMNVSPEDIRSQKSTAPISRARQTAVYIIREITGLSTEAIGKEFGGRDHSTIVYSYNKAKKTMETDVSYRHMIEDVIKNIRSR
ncbi:MAG: chromosomal replication initiator protein DnaA, partial [Clostridia bacterium]|nr:chromosomal replication initiator protein DnaA [Clostridia bacterium]